MSNLNKNRWDLEEFAELNRIVAEEPSPLFEEQLVQLIGASREDPLEHTED